MSDGKCWSSLCIYIDFKETLPCWEDFNSSPLSTNHTVTTASFNPFITKYLRPLATSRMPHKVHFKFNRLKTGCHVKVKEPNLPYYLPIVRRRLVRCISFTIKLEFFFNNFYANRDIGPAVRVFANGPGDLDSIPGRVIPRTLINGTWYHLAYHSAL